MMPAAKMHSNIQRRCSRLAYKPAAAPCPRSARRPTHSHRQLLARAAAGYSSSYGEDEHDDVEEVVAEGYGYSSDTSDDSEDTHDMSMAMQAFQSRYPRKVHTFCFNCSSKAILGTPCQLCGHQTLDDHALKTACTVDVHSRASAATSPVLLAWDTKFNEHAMPVNSGEDPELGTFYTFMHPERPERAGIIVRQMQQSGLAEHCRRVACRYATMDELTMVHSERYIDALRRASQVAGDEQKVYLIGEQGYLLAGSWHAFLLAAGTAAELAERLVRGDGDAGAAVLRPPGHLASRDGSCGWCFVNSAAVAARAAQKAGARRVAIVDWGVHHGQGTQEIFYEDDTVLTISLHTYQGGTYFPGTGDPTDIGKGKGEGYNINVAWDTHGLGNSDYLAAFRHIVLPALRDFDPQLIIVSAGFDAVDGDMVGHGQLMPDGYATMTYELHSIAPTLLLLEGGYNLRALGDSFHECVRALTDPESADPLESSPKLATTPTRTGLLAIAKTLAAASKHWPSMEELTFDELMLEYDCLGAMQILWQVLNARRAPALK